MISNRGAFGEDVVKIGLTRRLEPHDRVYELGGASVPFRFDVHALFFSEDAVTLETELHQHFAAPPQPGERAQGVLLRQPSRGAGSAEVEGRQPAGVRRGAESMEYLQSLRYSPDGQEGSHVATANQQP